MDVTATLSPGENVTRALLRAYDEQLICVR
jgi:hypothetical protein